MMRIKINRILGDTIWFKSEQGEGRAQWDGPPPKVGNIYNVEIDLPGRLQWGTDIIPTLQTECVIKLTNKIVNLFGKIESIETDGVCYMRFGDDLVALEAYGTPPNNVVYIMVSAKNLVLYNVY